MKQALHPGGALDMLTKPELTEALGHHADSIVREAARGVKVMRMPVIRESAPAAAFTLGANPEAQGPGPEQGYIWRICRIMVASGTLSDNAQYTLYAGSDPTATDAMHLIDGIVGHTGATAGQFVNIAFRPGNKSEWIFPGEQVYAGLTGATVGTTYTLTGIVTEVPAEMVAKIA
jgi:hypothetical protein